MSKQSWQDRINQKVREHNTLEQKTRRSSPNVRRLQITVQKEFLTDLHKVCEARGISLAGYMRRSIAKQVALDLGVPVTEVAKGFGYPAAYGEFWPPLRYQVRHFNEDGTKNNSVLPDDMTGYGEW